MKESTLLFQHAKEREFLVTRFDKSSMNLIQPNGNHLRIQNQPQVTPHKTALLMSQFFPLQNRQNVFHITAA